MVRNGKACSPRNKGLPCRLPKVNEINPELERLVRAEQEAHGRFLRLQMGFTDTAVLSSANELWQTAAANLLAYRKRISST